MRRLILASQSPRRVDLLREAGFVFEAIPADIEEAMDAALRPPELTGANASLKAAHISQRHPEAVVLGADTLVYLDEQPLGKPADLQEAVGMITRLSGRTHQVCTAVALHCEAEAHHTTFHVITEVTFKPLASEEINRYLAKINPLDKAGGYAAQEHGSLVIERVEGSWTNVVGLPMDEVTKALAGIGISPTER